MYKIKSQENGEVLFKTTSKKKLLKEIEEYKQVKKFNNKNIPFQVYVGDDLKAEFNTNYNFNEL